MHIPDGFVPPSVCVAGYAITGGATWYSLYKIDQEKHPQAKIPKAALLTAAFFVLTLINIPIPPSSAHLVLNGLMGVILGYFAFPAILVGLFFQAAMFQHGGLSTLGINAVIMGVPATIAYYIYRLRRTIGDGRKRTAFFAFLAGASGVAIAAVIFAGVIITTIPAEIDAQTERNTLYVSLGIYSITAIVEGIFTAMLVAYLKRVKPELLESR